MISPMTPPGTPLVVVWTTVDTNELLALFKPEYRSRVRDMERSPENKIWVGQRLTLARIEPCEFVCDEFLAEVQERPGECYALKCFDIAVLPKVLTDLQVPVEEDA